MLIINNIGSLSLRMDTSQRKQQKESEVSQIWIDAIISNNVEAVENILNKCTHFERETFINGDFINPGLDNDTTALPNVQYSGHSAKTSWNLAICSGSLGVIYYLINNGVNVLQKDEDKNNVLHNLVEFASLHCDSEVKCVETYQFLQFQLKYDDISELLMMENSHGLRPLELAARLATLKLFNVIFETKGVHLTEERYNGINKVQLFDVTEYERSDEHSRYQKSPIKLLLWMDKKKLAPQYRDETTHEMMSDPLASWMKAKFRMNIPYMVAWGIFRLVFCLLLW